MQTNTSFSKSSLVLALAFMALLFNACRKSSSSVDSIEIMEDFTPARFRHIAGTYMVKDTFRTNSGGSTVYSYNTFAIKVTAKDSTMIQFDQLLDDKYVYTYVDRFMWPNDSFYTYSTYDKIDAYTKGASYLVKVKFSGNFMSYYTFNTFNNDFHTGNGVKL